VLPQEPHQILLGQAEGFVTVTPFGSATRTSAALPHPHGSLTHEALIARYDERRREERRRAMEHVAVRHGS
jgi:hypothetical protein